MDIKLFIKKWMQIVRAQYLLLCIILSTIGNGIAWFEDTFQWSTAILSLIGLLLAHSSVNILNDYCDHKSGIDEKTNRSPFNGGSGSIQDGIIDPKTALWVGSILLACAAFIGIYFIVKIPTGWQLIPLLLAAGFFVIAYTPFLLKHRGAEWAAGIGLGALPVLGTYFVQAGHYSLLAILASIPSTILVHNLLLVNEFPDAQADQTANRKTAPIVYGAASAGSYYLITLVVLYVYIAENVFLGFFPLYCLLSLFTIPMALKVKTLIRLPVNKFQPAMQLNVGIVMLTQLLLGIGFIISRFLS